MNILYLSIEYFYLNPTRSCFQLVLSKLGVDFLFVGSREFSELNPDDIYATLDTYDLIIVSRDFVPYQGIDQHLSKLTRYTNKLTVNSFDIDTWNKVLSYLSANRKKSVLFLVDNDCLGNTYQQLDHYLSFSSYFIAPAQNMCLNPVPPYLEPFTYNKSINYHQPYSEFQKSYKSFIFDCSHILADNEFIPYSDKSSFIHVPGASYTRRKLLSSFLASFPHHRFHYINSSFFFNTLCSLLFYLYPDLYSFERFVLLRQRFFKRLLTSSYISLTDGGYQDFTVRKLFEIPASFSVLACWPTSYLISSGFIHGQDFIDCSKFSTFENFLDYTYSLSPAQLLSLASNGYSKIYAHHSVSSKLKSFSIFFSLAAKSSFLGSELTSDGNTFFDS